MQDAPRVDLVEALVLERQAFRIRYPDVTLEPFERQPPTNELDPVLREVDSGHLGACSGELDEIGSKPDADLQHALSTRGGKVGH